MDDSSSPFVSGASTNVDRFVPNHDNDGMLNVYYILRKKKARQAAEEHRNAVLEYQSKALKDQIKKLTQLYEQDLLNSN